MFMSSKYSVHSAIVLWVLFGYIEGEIILKREKVMDQCKSSK